MSEITQYSLDFSNMIRGFPDAIADKFRVLAGLDLKVLIQMRVQKGVNAEGGGFKEYAEKTKQIRAENKMQTAFKDFTFTGEMWRGFGVKSFSKSTSKLSVTLGGKTPKSAEKLQKNTAREERNIIEPSKEELRIIEENLITQIENYINNI